MPTFDTLQREIDEIKSRNRRVEADKAWETGWARKLIIVLLTYAVIVVLFFVSRLPNPFANAAVPTVAFVLSTLTLSVLKKWWMKNVYRNERRDGP